MFNVFNEAIGVSEKRKIEEDMEKRNLLWFSCGVTSAVMTKLLIDKGLNCEVLYCDTGSEHEDNKRFLQDIEKWIGKKIIVLKNPKYDDIYDVFEDKKFIVQKSFAPCTIELKKIMRLKYQRDTDTHYFGYDVGEQKRAVHFRKRNPEIKAEFPLIDLRYSKQDCINEILKAKIDLPVMYKMGYKNNNCIGCVKGGLGYWNKIRKDFPDHFNKMAKLERELNVKICKITTNGIRHHEFLDKISPDIGNYDSELSIDCGIFCELEK